MRDLATLASDAPEDCTPEVLRLARVGKNLLRVIVDEQTAPTEVLAAE